MAVIQALDTYMQADCSMPLQLHVVEAGHHHFGDTGVYRSQSKEPVDPDLYRKLTLGLCDRYAEGRVIP